MTAVEPPSVLFAVRAGDQWRVYPCAPVGPPVLRPYPLPAVTRPGPVTDVIPRVDHVETTRLLPKLSAAPLPAPAHATAARAPHTTPHGFSPVQAVVPAPTTPPPPATPDPAPTPARGRHRRPSRLTRWRTT